MKIKVAIITSLISVFCAQTSALCEVTDKALVVLIFDHNCPIWCEQVKPVIGKLKKKYSDKVSFEDLDASSETLEKSKKKAKSLGISQQFDDSLDYAPSVLVFKAKQRKKPYKILNGPKKQEIYENAINGAGQG